MGSDSCGSFHHPYEPYDIQLRLMRCIYDSLEDGKKMAILESPTGTGKTLSLICSIVTWLRDNKVELLTRRQKGDVGSESDSESDGEPDWVNEAYTSSALESTLHEIGDYESYLDKLKPQAQPFDGKLVRRKRPRNVAHIDISVDEADFLPQAYTSDSEDYDAASRTSADRIRDEVSALLANLESDNKQGQAVQENCHNPVKIFFASRTHSQLSQFASQLALPNFPSSFSKFKIPTEKVKYLPLASRKQLCINPAVNKLGSVDAVNEACSELLKAKSGKSCPFYKPSSNNKNLKTIKSFQDQTFVKIRDIEDLTDIGNSLKICPFYASRSAITGAEIVTLPYQYLLSESTRESLSIDLANSIVVIDEAHNLLETINTIHSAEVSLSELKLCLRGLDIYLNKFKTRLNPGNRVNLIKLMKLVNILIQFIGKNFKKPGQQIDANFLLLNSNADTLNVHKINKYIQKTKIAFKIGSYIESQFPEDSKSQSQPLLFKIASFISCLSNPAKEGQFFFEKGHSIKYMLLEPGKPFQSILEKARCVILAGGTMQPVSDILDNLTSTVSHNEIEVFSCNHVIPDENLETYIMRNPQFEFTFEKRENPTLIKDLFQFYYKLSHTVPLNGGIVGFFPSYQYLDFVIKEWKKLALYQNLDVKRKIFYESKGGQDPLPDYSDSIANAKGAILFAVVGGKLSEGINFQDNLCRAVVMTGLPFPNVFSGELLIKRKHLENKVIDKGGSKEEAGKAVKDFYETICMKAVNQSIGRAIRHVNDYSLIYLLDKRYDNDNIKSKLSHWVSRRIRSQATIDGAMTSTRIFFSQHERSH